MNMNNKSTWSYSRAHENSSNLSRLQVEHRSCFFFLIILFVLLGTVKWLRSAWIYLFLARLQQCTLWQHLSELPSLTPSAAWIFTDTCLLTQTGCYIVHWFFFLILMSFEAMALVQNDMKDVLILCVLRHSLRLVDGGQSWPGLCC